MKTRSVPLVSRRRLAVIAMIVACGVGVAWWSFSHARGEIGREKLELRQRFARARDTIRLMEVVPAGASTEVDRLVRSAIASDSIASDALPADARERLATDVSRFLGARFGDGSADEYIRWRREAGYLPREIEDLRQNWFLDQTYEFLFHEPVPDDVPWNELHARVVAAMDRLTHGEHRLDRIASAPGAVAVVVKRLTRADPSWPPVGALPGELLDTGNAIATSQSWWTAPIDVEDLLERNGEALVAQVAFVGEFGNGARRPISLSHVWDPDRRRWWLVAIHVGVTRRGTATTSNPIRLEF